MNTLTRTTRFILASIVLLAAVGFGVTSAAGVWSNPASSSDSRDTFVNEGPVKQIKEGSLGITDGATTTPPAGTSFMVTGPAEVLGGIYTTHTNPGATLPNAAAVIDGDLCVGFADCLTQAIAPAIFNLLGKTEVTNNVRAENLAHGTSSTYEPVCVTSDGWLVPCQATTTTPSILLTEKYGCFVAGTEVVMADGSIKNIEDVEIGEVVKGSDGKNAVVKKYEIDYKGALYSLNGSDYFVSASHPFMTLEGWKSFNPSITRLESPGLEVSQLQEGDVLVREHGELEELTTFDYIIVEETVYNFGLDGTSDFYADGYLVHNADLFAAEIGGPGGINIGIGPGIGIGDIGGNETTETRDKKLGYFQAPPPTSTPTEETYAYNCGIAYVNHPQVFYGEFFVGTGDGYYATVPAADFDNTQPQSWANPPCACPFLSSLPGSQLGADPTQYPASSPPQGALGGGSNTFECCYEQIPGSGYCLP